MTPQRGERKKQEDCRSMMQRPEIQEPPPPQAGIRLSTGLVRTRRMSMSMATTTCTTFRTHNTKGVNGLVTSECAWVAPTHEAGTTCDKLLLIHLVLTAFIWWWSKCTLRKIPTQSRHPSQTTTQSWCATTLAELSSPRRVVCAKQDVHRSEAFN